MYIIDFYIPKAFVAFEIDGFYHMTQIPDDV